MLTNKPSSTIRPITSQMQDFIDGFMRQAKLAENQLLVAALRRDAGEIDDSDLSLAAHQYALAVSNWRLARQTYTDEITERN